MLRLIVSISLLLSCFAVVAFPEAVTRLAGFSRLGEPSIEELDERSAGEDRSSPRFLAERNQVRLTVPAETTLGEFLRTNQIQNPELVGQIVEQAGLETLDAGLVLPAGKEFRLQLTPEASIDR